LRHAPLASASLLRPSIAFRTGLTPGWSHKSQLHLSRKHSLYNSFPSRRCAKKRGEGGGGWWIRKIKIKRGKEMAGEIETRKISRKINDRPVHRFSLSLSLLYPTPRRAYEIQFTACAISLQLAKRMTCQPEGWARSGGPLVNHFAITADQCSVLRSPVTREGVP
jgi:hypothetical protein